MEEGPAIALVGSRGTWECLEAGLLPSKGIGVGWGELGLRGKPAVFGCLQDAVVGVVPP